MPYIPPISPLKPNATLEEKERWYWHNRLAIERAMPFGPASSPRIGAIIIFCGYVLAGIALAIAAAVKFFG